MDERVKGRLCRVLLLLLLSPAVVHLNFFPRCLKPQSRIKTSALNSAIVSNIFSTIESAHRHPPKMPNLFRKTLTCFYCNTKSSQQRTGNIRKWQCESCDAVNHLDEVCTLPCPSRHMILT